MGKLSYVKNSFNNIPRLLKLEKNVFQNMGSSYLMQKRNTCEDKKGALRCKGAVVTNVASDMGYTTAKFILQEGAAGVLITDLNEKKGLLVLEKLCKEFPNKAVFKKCDFSKRDQVDDLLFCTKKTFSRLDVLVNMPGMTNEVEWEKSVCLHSYGTVFGTLAGIKYMGAETCGYGGIIINVTGIDAIVPDHKGPVSSGISHFKLAFTRSIGNLWYYDQTNVKVMALLVGPTEDKMNEPDAPSEPCEKPKTETTAKQNPDCVAKCVIEMIVNGCPGSIYVAHECQCFKIEMPPKESLINCQ